MIIPADFKKEQIQLTRKIKFKNSKNTFDGVPLMMPPDDMYASFEVAEALPNVLTFISDDYEPEELYNFFFSNRPNSIYKITNLAKFQNLMGKLPKGYLRNVFISRPSFNETLAMVREVRKKHKNVTIWCRAVAEEWVYSDVVDEQLTSAGVDVIFEGQKHIVKVRECYTWQDNFYTPSDFYMIEVLEGFSEFKGHTAGDDYLERVYGDCYLPFSEKTLSEYYNDSVEKMRSILYDNGCKSIQLYEYTQ